MKRVLFWFLLFPTLSFADVTANLITGAWSGVQAPTSILYPSNEQVGYNPTTKTLLFTNTMATTEQVVAINTALSGTGIKVSGYNYSWQIHNTDPYKGTLQGNVSLTSSSGRLLQSWTYNYAPMAPGPLSEGFTLFSGTENFTNPHLLPDLGNLTISWTGQATQDTRPIYAGPRVRQQSLTLNYGVDQCVVDPLSSPSCPEYKDRMCSMNSLYDPSCPGYAAAYLAQQCSISALYSPSCPGYAAAYLSQQCSINPLYDVSCPGYSAAYLAQRCLADTFFSKDCPGYTDKVLTIVNQATPVITDTYVAEELYPPAVTTDPSRVDIAAVPLVGTQPTALVDYELSIATREVIPKQSSNATSNTPNYNPTTVREALEENNRIKRTQAAIIRGNNSINSLGSAADLEEQKSAQSDIIEAMDDDPRFEAYRKKRIKDAQGYPQYVVYGNQRTVDNRQLGRRLFGPNQQLHEEMVNSQYNR